MALTSSYVMHTTVPELQGEPEAIALGKARIAAKEVGFIDCALSFSHL